MKVSSLSHIMCRNAHSQDFLYFLGKYHKTHNLWCNGCNLTYKWPSRISLEFPSGLMEEGESLECAALRELEEETGHTGTVTVRKRGVCSPTYYIIQS